jgi:hypothetical protein
MDFDMHAFRAFQEHAVVADAEGADIETSPLR